MLDGFPLENISDPGTPVVLVDGQTLESVRVSFFLPVICFVVIAVYGFLSNAIDRKAHPGGA